MLCYLFIYHLNVIRLIFRATVAPTLLFVFDLKIHAGWKKYYYYYYFVIIIAAMHFMHLHTNRHMVIMKATHKVKTLFHSGLRFL